MKLFVWDLHGTLEQGNERAVIEISNQILASHGLVSRFSEAHIQQLYGLKWFEYFEFLLPDEAHEKHLELQAACFALSNSDEGTRIIAKHMTPAKNAHQVLDVIHAAHKQVLLSNTTPQSIPMFVSALDMQKYFTPENAKAVNLHNKHAKGSKADTLRTFVVLDDYEEIIVIGDSDSDMALAEAIGGKGYLYSHVGVPFRSERGFRQIRDLAELLEEI